MQQLFQLCCDWTDNGHMFLHQGAKIFINSIDIVKNVTHLRTISNIEIPAHSVVTIPTRKTGRCTTNTPCIFEVDINKILSVNSLQLVMLQTFHLKCEV